MERMENMWMQIFSNINQATTEDLGCPYASSPSPFVEQAVALAPHLNNIPSTFMHTLMFH